MAERDVQSEEERIGNFVQWCEEVGIVLHQNICISHEGSCDGIGVIAEAAISEGECVALIPRTALLSCANSSIKPLVLEDKKLNQECTSSWVPLLLSLAAEYSSASSSKWLPYLSLVPSSTNPPPMLWSKSNRQKLLKGTGIDHLVSKDLRRIKDDFLTLVHPFMEQYPHIFRKVLHKWQIYKKLVAFVMSYSFTDERVGPLGRTAMVPFVDLLNHSSFHHVELSFHKHCLKLMAIRNIKKGEEVMNTYGQLSNAELLHMYGFTETGNPNDEAVINVRLLKKVYLLLSSNNLKRLNAASLTYFGDVNVLDQELIIDGKGEPDTNLLALTRLLCCKRMDELQEDWQPLSLDECSLEELSFLQMLAEKSLDGYPEGVKIDSTTTQQRHSHTFNLISGQQNSLRKFIFNCSKLPLQF